jgi:hypothetical protein
MFALAVPHFETRCSGNQSHGRQCFLRSLLTGLQIAGQQSLMGLIYEYPVCPSYKRRC